MRRHKSGWGMLKLAKMAARTPAPYGEHDNDFVDQHLDKLTCTVCTKVVLDPHLTACCGQNFCSSCLTQWFTKTKKESCPHCRAEGCDFQHIPDKRAKREVDELKVRCSNKKEGCDWVGKLEDLKKHLDSKDGCDYVEVECPNKCMHCYFLHMCTSTFQRKYLSKHLKEDCSRRPTTCEYCGLKGEYNTISMHIQWDCPEKPLNCPNECNAQAIKRKNLNDHQAICPLEPVSCPFKNAGCSQEIARKDLDSHVAANTQQHLLQTFQRTEKLQNSMEAIKDEIEFLLQTDLNKHCVKTSLAYMSTHLSSRDDMKMFRMTGFSNHKKNGRVWQSPAFYIPGYSGIHFHIKVNANGVGSGQSSHVSVSIMTYITEKKRHSGYFGYEVSVSLLGQVPPLLKPSANGVSQASGVDTSKEWTVTSTFDHSKEITVEVNEQFLLLTDLNNYLLNDSVVFTCTVKKMRLLELLSQSSLIST